MCWCIISIYSVITVNVANHNHTLPSQSLTVWYVFGACRTLKFPHFIIHMSHVTMCILLTFAIFFAPINFSVGLLWLSHLPNLGLTKCVLEQTNGSWFPARKLCQETTGSCCNRFWRAFLDRNHAAGWHTISPRDQGRKTRKLTFTILICVTKMSKNLFSLGTS